MEQFFFAGSRPKSLSQIVRSISVNQICTGNKLSIKGRGGESRKLPRQSLTRTFQNFRPVPCRRQETGSAMGCRVTIGHTCGARHKRTRYGTLNLSTWMKIQIISCRTMFPPLKRNKETHFLHLCNHCYRYATCEFAHVSSGKCRTEET